MRFAKKNRLCSGSLQSDRSTITVETLERRSLLAAHLLADIDPTDQSSQVGYYVNLNGTALFEANGSLYRSDGTAAGTTAIHFFNSIGYPMVVMGPNAYFIVNKSLWETDGTTAGTVVVSTVPGSNGLFLCGNELYFAVVGQLWKSDGSTAGTMLVRSFKSGSYAPNEMTLFDGEVYFGAADSSVGTGLWKTDGTAAGTTIVKATDTTLNDSQPSDLVVSNGLLYFSGTSPTSGEEPWRSDGTTAGTFQLAELSYGMTSSFPSSFVTVGDATLFIANGYLYSTDGTTVRNVTIADPNDAIFSLSNLISVNNIGFFDAYSTTSGQHAYRTDGTSAGTFPIEQFNSPSSSFPSVFTPVGNDVIFEASDNNDVPQLYMATPDGSATLMPSSPNLLSGVKSSGVPGFFVPIGGLYYFTGSDSIAGTEPFVTDLTPGGTRLLSDLNTTPNSSNPLYPGVINGNAYYVAATSTGTNWWGTDGTTAGTLATNATLVPEPYQSTDAVYVESFNGSLYYFEGVGESDGSEGQYFDRFDGQSVTQLGAITEGLRAVVGNPWLTVFNGKLYFAGDDGFSNYGVLQTDGTVSGTQLALGPALLGGADLFGMAATSNALIVAGVPSASGAMPTLYSSDGTAAGTTAIATFSGDTFTSFVQAGKYVYFTVANATNYLTSQLYRTDGTAAGTVLLQNSNEAASPLTYTFNAMASSGHIYFERKDGQAIELWTSDGTSAGTLELTSLPNNSTVEPVATLGNLFIFAYDDGVHGNELWESDGTASGTHLQSDINPGAAAAFTAGTAPSAVVFDGRLYFAANDGVHGNELWSTDGTATGTILEQDINTGSADSSPSSFAVLGTELVFAATDATHGRELWEVDAPPVKPSTGSVTGTVTDAPAGEVVFLDANSNGVLDSGELSTTTSSTGAFRFASVPVGSYVLRQLLPSEYTQSSPTNNAGIAVSVTAGVSLTGENFVDAATPTTGSVAGTVSGGVAGETVFLDANNNGVLDSGELSTTTSSSGTFDFSNVPVGTYTLRQVLSGGYTQTSPTGNAGILVTVSRGAALTGENFVDVLSPSGAISGTVFNDANGNAKFDSTEAGLAGITVYSDANNNGILDSGELSTLTLSDGSYRFTGLAAGNYNIRATLPSGFKQTTPASNYGFTIALEANQVVAGENFGQEAVVTTGSVAGTVTGGPSGETVFLDSNNNGVLDSGELSATTSSTGAFSFAAVPAGSYVLRQVLTGGYTQTTPAGSAGIAVTVASGAALTGENFVDAAPITMGSVAGTVTGSTAGETVYLDANNNGVLDTGELSTTTSSTGAYSFATVPAGSYVVRQVLPSGYTQTSPAGSAGIAVAVAAGSVLVGENFTDAAAVATPPQLTGTTIGTAGSYNNSGNTIAKATDGILSTFFDGPTASGDWVGLDLGTAGGVVTEIKFASRSGWASRMNGGIFQASDSATFASGVVNLYTIPAGANPSSTSLTTATFANSTAYRYYRYLSPSGSYGDVAEVQFFGTAGGLTTPVGPTQLTGATIGTAGSYNNGGNTIAKATDGILSTFFDGPTANGDWVGLDLGTAGGIVTEVQFASRAGWASRMNGGIFQASDSATFASGVVNLYTIPAGANPSSTSLTTATVANSTAYRYYRYLSPSGSYGDVAEVQFFGTAGGLTTPVSPTQLIGTTIGTAGSYQSSGNTIAKATDGNLSTFFDGPTSTGNWVGLDLGSSQTTGQIEYAPRSGWASRMVGGEFQVSTTADFSSGVMTIYTITTTPPVGSLTTVTLSSPVTARYVRYLAPAGSYGDISEFQVFT